MMALMILINPKSISPRNRDITRTSTISTAVDASNSLRVGHLTFFNSILDSRKNWPEIPTYRKMEGFFWLFPSDSLLGAGVEIFRLFSSFPLAATASEAFANSGFDVEGALFFVPFLFFF